MRGLVLDFHSQAGMVPLSCDLRALRPVPGGWMEKGTRAWGTPGCPPVGTGLVPTGRGAGQLRAGSRTYFPHSDHS